MSLLSIDDLRRFSEAMLLIHGTRNAGDFSTNILAAMRQILSVDICVVDWYGFQGLPPKPVFFTGSARIFRGRARFVGDDRPTYAEGF